MVRHIMDLDYRNNESLENIFKTIAKGNSILFLGAGASVTAEKKFLSKDIIEFFEDKKQISWNIHDIIEFVDALSSNPNFSREEFDNYVDECLRLLEITDAHRSIARSQWRLIITTNYDLLIEKAFAEIERTHEEVNALKAVHNIHQYHSIQARNEVKYVKLNGCLSDKRDYKLVFSSDDFSRAGKFYKNVLEDLKNLSDNVMFLSVGYSYSDDFAKKLLNKFDSYNFRQNKVMYNIDPYINEAMLPKYADNRICVIKATVEDFFAKYEEWKTEKEIVTRLYTNNNFRNNQDEDMFIPTHIKKRIGENLRQLNGYYTSRVMQEDEFYKGGEPNYNIILKSYDVVKNGKIEEVKNKIVEIIESKDNNSRILPLFFFTGTFGTGKSTFAYRLINRLNQLETSTISFEIFDPVELRVSDLREIFSKSNSSYIFLYVNTIEINSVFKSLLDLRNRLSIEANPETKIILLASIRENILLKYKEDREIRNSFDINVDTPFERNEIKELVEKLKNSGVISYRDINERTIIESKIIKDFAGDSFISLLELVQGNRLVEDLMQAYHQLNDKCKKAFLYTSLLYQFKILMPSGLLQSLVSSDWESFRSEVIEKDGKGILIQEIYDSKGTDPDLYFRTKHPVISQKLISTLLLDEDIKFNHIKSIITHIFLGSKNTKLIVDFLKANIAYKQLSFNKVDFLYDLADEHLSEDPLFLLHYSINLQHRHDEKSLIKAITKIQYAESLSDKNYRNHYLIHRRGALTFELAKIYFKKYEPSLAYKVYQLVNEARDFFEIKRALDPFSSFSYTDLLNLEVWCLEKLDEEKQLKLHRRIYIEELMDIALRTVFENTNRIFEIKNRYIEKFKFQNNEVEYLEYLDSYYNDPDSRPYALVLLFNHFLSKSNTLKCDELLSELENLSLNRDVLNLLLKYYGRQLYRSDFRMKFFDLLRSNPSIEDWDNLRYNYFNFIAECYNRNFPHAYKFLSTIRDSFHHINPDFHQAWIDQDTGQNALFEAVLRINNKGQKQFYIPDMNLWVKSENWDKTWELKMNFDVELHFYIYGLKARAINIITDDFEDEDKEWLSTEDLEL